jgi:arginase
MGAGPERFVHSGVEQTLRNCGYDVYVDCIEAHESFRAEIKTAFELYGTLAECVGSAYHSGVFPLVLSGNCSSCLGTVAGVDPIQLGIIWFDSHGDFNTPATTESGFLDGMGLATAAGLCWEKMAASIPDFKPISGRNILHIGGRAFHPEEQELFETSGGNIVPARVIRETSMREALEPSLKDLASRVTRIYLHFDLDVLDPTIAPANEFAAPDGLTLAQVQEAIQMIGERFTICASGIASYDPQYDKKDKILTSGIEIMKSILATVMAHRA